MIEYWYNQKSCYIEHVHFESLGSTQVYGRDRVEQLKFLPCNAWHLVTADCQTKGIAQRDRKWNSPKSVNIYATYTIPFPIQKMPLLFNIAQVTTIAVARVLEKFGLSPEIKWVNDLLIDGKKICGVLCENRGSLISAPDAIILLIGIGLNVNMRIEDCQNLGQPVTSLFLETGKEYSRQYVLEVLSESLFNVFQTFILYGFSPLLPYLRERMFHIKKKIVMEENGIAIEGVFEGITDKGTMLLNVDGKIQERISGRIIRNG